jgi:excisionase family DNA binding protein
MNESKETRDISTNFKLIEAKEQEGEALLSSGEELVITVPEAGRRLKIGRNAAYEAAKRGEIPIIRIGRLLRVPVAILNEKLRERH